MKRVVITDPCYLIDNEDWDRLIDECEAQHKKNWFDFFGEKVATFLKDVSGDNLAVADKTGFGDWTNEIDEVEFGAESGMVCVVEYTRDLQKYLEKNNISIIPGLAALIPVDDKAVYEIDTNDPCWSVVRIKSGNEWICSCEP